MDSVLHHILSTKLITDYLSAKGHEPVKQISGGRLLYRCPFPDHNETKPSFTVWTNSEYQNFYCFGCGRNHNIINLVAGLENIGLKESFKKLNDGVEISLDDKVLLEIERINNKKVFIPDCFETEQMLFLISAACQEYLCGVNYDKEELLKIDKVYEKIDSYIMEYEFDKIEQLYDNLIRVLQISRKKYEERSFNYVDRACN